MRLCLIGDQLSLSQFIAAVVCYCKPLATQDLESSSFFPNSIRWGEKIAYNRSNPQVHHWFIPRMPTYYGVSSQLPTIISPFAAFVMQLWGYRWCSVWDGRSFEYPIDSEGITHHYR
jgi:hypothetical protein